MEWGYEVMTWGHVNWSIWQASYKWQIHFHQNTIKTKVFVWTHCLFCQEQKYGKIFSPSFLKGNRHITCYYDYPTVTVHKLQRCILLFAFSAIFPCSPQPCQNRRVTYFCAATHQLRSTNLKYDLKDVVPFFSTISF